MQQLSHILHLPHALIHIYHNQQLEDAFDFLHYRPQELSINRLRKNTALLPAIQLRAETISPNRVEREASQRVDLSPPPEIERPKSALHAGNFTEDADELGTAQHIHGPIPEVIRRPIGPLGISPASPWFKSSSPDVGDTRDDPGFSPAQAAPIATGKGPLRSRAPSLQSFSSNYILKAPTSPLVQEFNNDDEEFSPIELSKSPVKSQRRKTLPPSAFQNLKSLPGSNTTSLSPTGRQGNHIRTEGSSPHQGHSVRRSITTNWSFQPVTSPQLHTSLHSRRPSFSSEASPLHHASMVGSYEESILRGRMSTGPSKPLDFTAQIGVLGRGNCKPKFPAHVTVPFPAVYYSWNNHTGRHLPNFDDGPSPYVGHIDLEHSLCPVTVNGTRRRNRGASRLEGQNIDGAMESDEHKFAVTNSVLRKREKRKRRSPSPKAPSGGSYRIPERGQLQIVIKNPHKTAVKLFLVPYDLSGMEGGMKTFIRQRCYSAGPIIEDPLTTRSVSEPALDGRAKIVDTKTKASLRYMIHLNVCCPSKGRFYLHQHIRVVFANRVPDNKENLQTDIQLPEPRYSIYKPSRDNVASMLNHGGRHTADNVQRRGYVFGSMAFDTLDGISSRHNSGIARYPSTTQTQAPPVPSIPLDWARKNEHASPGDDANMPDGMDLDSPRRSPSGPQSPLAEKTKPNANILSTSYRSSSSQSSGDYGKLSKGDAGYGGIYGRPGTPEPGEGLLARRLRGLGMDKAFDEMAGE